jgi:hypothetical protein
MATRFDNRSVTSFDYDDLDTIEMELTPEQMLALTQAAAASLSPPAPPAPSVMAPPVIVRPVIVPSAITSLVVASEVKHHARVKPRVGMRVAIALGIAGAAVVLSGVAYIVGKRSAPVQVVTMTLPPPPPPPAAQPVVPEMAVAQLEPVRFKNPFDATEVFEFPAGTSRDEARDAVAELLLERAHERQNTNRIEQVTTNGLAQQR